MWLPSRSVNATCVSPSWERVGGTNTSADGPASNVIVVDGSGVEVVGEAEVVSGVSAVGKGVNAGSDGWVSNPMIRPPTITAAKAVMAAAGVDRPEMKVEEGRLRISSRVMSAVASSKRTAMSLLNFSGLNLYPHCSAELEEPSLGVLLNRGGGEAE